MQVEIVTATHEHVSSAIKGMRQDERAQLWDGFRWLPETSVRACVMRSTHTFAALVDGEVMAVFGVCIESPLLGVGIPWLACTGLVDSHPKTFYRLCKEILPEFAKRWPRLAGIISAKHQRSLSWAKHLGFKITESGPMGPDAVQFHRVELSA